MSDGHQIKTAEAALQYMLAGRATVTLVSKKTGQRFTFKIKSPKEANDDAPRFVNLLRGADNEGDYSYMATIFSRKDLRWSAKSKVEQTAPSAKAFQWAFNKLIAGQLPDQLEIWHEGRCGKCGRKLTVPESIATGLGPECSANAGVARVKLPRPPKAPKVPANDVDAQEDERERYKDALADHNAEDIEAEMQRMEAEGDREQTERDELNKFRARLAMECG